ncbi:MAG: hypothetical protein CM1200mP20_10260 [Pseudomonadota bacterium]|nr:MAG: hypothetical protein CM1200mP20_10260 [Pseudomonadota bacterium]
MGTRLISICLSEMKTGTVIFIHGMAVLGAEDPRVQQLARALTVAGLKVLIPHLTTTRGTQDRA